MLAARSNLPKKQEIHAYWRGHIGDKTLKSYGIVIGNFDTCFACGFHLKVERAHIVAVSDGGTNDCENIHLLCPNCHVESENLNEKYYWIWLKNSNARRFKLPVQFSSEQDQLLERDYNEFICLINSRQYVDAAKWMLDIYWFSEDQKKIGELAKELEEKHSAT